MKSSWPHHRPSRSRAQQHQSQSPRCQQTSEPPPQASTRPHMSTLPSQSPLYPHCIEEQLHHSLNKLHLQPQQQESSRRGLARCGQTALQCTLQDVPISYPYQPQGAHPMVLQGNRSVLTLPQIWVTHCHYQLTWPTSYEMPLMNRLMFHAHLPLQP